VNADMVAPTVSLTRADRGRLSRGEVQVHRVLAFAEVDVVSSLIPSEHVEDHQRERRDEVTHASRVILHI
jgi:hypothetical protein